MRSPKEPMNSLVPIRETCNLVRAKTPWRAVLRQNAGELARERDRLKKRIQQAVGLADDADWWPAGKGADLVLCFGFAIDAHEDPDDNLALLLDEVQRRRQAPGETHLRNPRAWLQSALARRAAKMGMRWNKQADATEGQT